LSASSGAELSPDYYPLTYSDPTGERAVRNLAGRVFTLTAENGDRVLIRLEDLAPILDQWQYRVSRKGLIWAALKKEAPTE
jgi:hypothetical protein